VVCKGDYKLLRGYTRTYDERPHRNVHAVQEENAGSSGSILGAEDSPVGVYMT
jgi:hypothetical protein